MACLRYEIRDISRFSGVFRKIADRKRTDAELRSAKEVAEEASRAKSDFLASMSHELRTPLNAIIGYSEMLEEEAAETGNDGFVKDLKKIHGAGKHLVSLIGDILDLSKIEAGRVELLPESFDISSMIEDVQNTILPLLEKNENRLKVVCPESIGRMYADRVRLSQCLF